jgi:hypothetical protein
MPGPEFSADASLYRSSVSYRVLGESRPTDFIPQRLAEAPTRSLPETTGSAPPFTSIQSGPPPAPLPTFWGKPCDVPKYDACRHDAWELFFLAGLTCIATAIFKPHPVLTTLACGAAVKTFDIALSKCDRDVCGVGNVCWVNRPSGQGVCCHEGEHVCDWGCVDLRFDMSNCGECGHKCDPTQEYCVGGDCIRYCSQGQTYCNGQCVYTSSDPNNCGSCGNVCPPFRACKNGSCDMTSCSDPEYPGVGFVCPPSGICCKDPAHGGGWLLCLPPGAPCIT